MALVRWLLEDLIITDTSKENVFELQGIIHAAAEIWS